jgi:tetraacyldisaccharide 4'-kinase
MADPLTRLSFRGLSALMGAVWQGRRKLYELGLRTPERVASRVVSVGNLSVGGAGKTTLTLHLAARALERGVNVAVVTRRYRPGPGGLGDEELLYREALGEARVFAGESKRELARRAAAAGAELVLVDDGFSHWGLERDLDIVLLDRHDLWGGGRLLPAGRLREPIVALQRAAVVVVTRLLENEDPGTWLEPVRGRAPAALVAAARHAVTHVRWLDGGECTERGPGIVVSGTGNPQAVLISAREAGFGPLSLSVYPDHHWFTPAEATAARDAASHGTVILSPKDAVRWPAGAPRDRVAVLEPRWEWVRNGDAAEALVFDADESKAVVPVTSAAPGTRA